MTKREFLADEEIKRYLEENSTTKQVFNYSAKNSIVYDLKNHEAILEEYKKPLKWFKKLVVVSATKIEDKNILSLEEITDDVRYKEKFLKLFGDPKKYEFDPKEVFKRLKSIKDGKVSLNLSEAMWTDLVFRVLLFRLKQIFMMEIEEYLNFHIKYKRLEKHHKKLLKCIKLSKSVFDDEIVEKIIKSAEDFSNLLDSDEDLERFFMDLDQLIFEDNFYLKKRIPLYYFKKKDKLLKLSYSN